MKNIMKKSTLSRVALLATLISITGAYANTEHETTMQDFGAFVYAVERTFTDFFSQSNKTSYATHMIGLEKLFADFKRKIDAVVTRGNNDALTKEINDLIDYATQQFSIAHNIMKKYNGKSSSEAANFGAEIKKDFNTEKVFGEIVAKLKVLRCKAIESKDDALTKKIETIITMIEKKRKEWGAKSDWSLLAGLTYRMNCK
jgi:hypothetical protein